MRWWRALVNRRRPDAPRVRGVARPTWANRPTDYYPLVGPDGGLLLTPAQRRRAAQGCSRRGPVNRAR